MVRYRENFDCVIEVIEYGDGSSPTEQKAIYTVNRESTFTGSTYPDDPVLYPVIAPGAYEFTVTGHRGTIELLVEGGKGIKIVQNVNPVTGKNTAKHILVHEGYNHAFSGMPASKGSYGCPTVHSSNYSEFISNFNTGQTGVLIIKRK